MQHIAGLSDALGRVLDGAAGADGLIEAASFVLPFDFAFCIVNQRDAAPIHLGDTYPPGPAKDGVRYYVSGTYLLNPVYNAILDGLAPGIHRMADLAPDNWTVNTTQPDVLHEDSEEIGYRTPGWPSGLEEISLTVDLGNNHTGEISFARASAIGGFSGASLGRLQPVYPLFAAAFRALWGGHAANMHDPGRFAVQLEDFAKDILSPREAQIIQMVLKGHSSTSISLTLGIAMPTVKSHRTNAYAKLGISSQQQLFNAFLKWRSGTGA